MRDVAEVIAAKTGLGSAAVDPSSLACLVLCSEAPARVQQSDPRAPQLEPTGPTLLDDLEAGYHNA